mmetsp:Transcript_13433/g.32305  ORF Transcript_13433/g.32305 Transcript_13433/m.32305 type:complete len:124 (+) Transcript_13433:446-817(+)
MASSPKVFVSQVQALQQFDSSHRYPNSPTQPIRSSQQVDFDGEHANWGLPPSPPIPQDPLFKGCTSLHTVVLPNMPMSLWPHAISRDKPASPSPTQNMSRFIEQFPGPLPPPPQPPVAISTSS